MINMLVDMGNSLMGIIPPDYHSCYKLWEDEATKRYDIDMAVGLASACVP